MLGVEDLKEWIEVTDTTVECPVKGCTEKVERQRKDTCKKKTKFKCPIHKIVISPSTFEYPSESDNLLWKEGLDKELLEKIKEVKRESRRIAHDNSEDAVSWNIFRFLEKNSLIEGFLNLITGSTIKSSEVVYWSYSQEEDTSCSELNEARKEFGEKAAEGSEPDIIIKTDNALFFIEAKLNAGNETIPGDVSNSEKYEAGGDNWFSKVFNSDFETVAMAEKKYELMRFWLLGTWIAKQQSLDFYLISLTLSGREVNIETIFKRHIKENRRSKFLRVTWETIYQYILKSNFSRDKDIMIRYFRNKTIGYDRNGKLQRAFSIP
jgi:hypothetical protein